MYWTNAELKGRARARLSNRWGNYLVVGLLYLLISTVFQTVCTLADIPGLSELMLWNYKRSVEALGIDLAALARMAEDPYTLLALQTLAELQLTPAQIIGALVQIVLSVLLTIFVYQVLEVGLCRWMMEARGCTPSNATLFSGFANGEQWRNVAWVRFYTLVVSFLWSLLFVIPGLIYLYKVILVPYLLAENPYMSRRRAVQLSTTLTNGEKGRIFFLQLSFIGWMLLAGIAQSLATSIAPMLGLVVGFVGELMLLAYRGATMAELYAVMREKAFQLGYSDPSELAGFAA